MIPPGTRSTRRSPRSTGARDCYPDPAAFRPERFLGPDAPDTYTWMPFGGGTRRCLGASFATFEMQVVIRRVLERSRARAGRQAAREATAQGRHDRPQAGCAGRAENSPRASRRGRRGIDPRLELGCGMAKIFDAIDDQLRAWIGRQSLFFVATAPLDDKGHVNLSPKGPIGTLRVLGPREVAYLDLIGSGAETIAHLRENGRIVVMLCAFEGPPRIDRLKAERSPGSPTVWSWSPRASNHANCRWSLANWARYAITPAGEVEANATLSATDTGSPGANAGTVKSRRCATSVSFRSHTSHPSPADAPRGEEPLGR